MTTFLRSVLLLAFAASAAVADQSSDQETGLREHVPDVWALQHAKVIIRPGQMIEDATLVVRDGRIASVASGAPAPDDAQEIDLSGRTIYPGFIDAYSEIDLSTDRIKDTASHWNPNVVPQLSVAENFLANELNSDLRKQGIVAQLRAPKNKIIRGRSALVSTGTSDPKRALLATDVAQHLMLTAAARSRTTYPGSPMGAVALARQTIYDAQWYRDAWNAAKSDAKLPRPETNAALQALQPVLSRDMPVVIECFNELFALRADRFAAEFQLDLVIRGSGHEYRRLADIAATGRTLILPLSFPDAPDVSTAERAANVTLESLMHWDLAPENPARVSQAGINFAFCTDRLSSVGDFLKRLRTAVERGLSPEAALTALTLTPARLFDLEDQLGTLEPGRVASFIVTDGDIFAKKTDVLETWVDGRRFEYEPAPHRDLAGTYELKLQNSPAGTSKLFIQLKKDGSKVSGKLQTKPFEADSEEEDDKAKADAEKKEDQPADDSEKEASDSEEKQQDSPAATLKKPALIDYTATAQFDAADFGPEGMARLTLVFSTAPNDQNSPAAFGQIVWPDGKTSALTAKAVKPADDKELTEGEENDEQSDSAADEKQDSNDSEKDATKEESDNSDRASFAVNYPLGAFGRTELPQAAELTAFEHATIWTCGPAGILEDATLLIDNGRIVAVGTELNLPKNVRKVDARGLHITPGIIDCHSHMATDGGVNESTQAVTCEVRIGDFIDSDDISIYRQLAGGVTTSNILHGSANPIGGQNQVIKLRWGATPEQMKMHEAPPGVKFALGENVKQSNWGNEYTTRYPQTRMGVEQIFRDSFQAAWEYGERRRRYQETGLGLPVRRDLELDALLEIVRQKRWIHCHSYRQDEILALIRVLDEFGITIGTFQHILEGYKVADEMARHGAMASAFSDWWAYKFEVYDAIPYAGAMMHKAGIVVSFNSDDAELATRLNQEAAKAVKYGDVEPEEALKFVTLNPAKQLRIDQHVGSLEAGKQADFVVWNGPPLSNFTRCEQTWIDGARQFDRSEDQQLRQAIDEQRNTLIQKILTSGQKMKKHSEGEDDPTALWPRYDEYCRARGHQHIHQKQ